MAEMEVEEKIEDQETENGAKEEDVEMEDDGVEDHEDDPDHDEDLEDDDGPDHIQIDSEEPPVVVDPTNFQKESKAKRGRPPKGSKKRDVDSSKKYKYMYESRDCKVCGKVLSNIYKLQMHMKTHTGKYDFKCDVCDKGVRDSFRLVKHMQTDHKVYKEIDEKSLKEYIRFSQGTKCWYCNKKIPPESPAQLKEHMEKEHPEATLFTCSVCSLVFPSQSEGLFNLHMRAIHNDDTTTTSSQTRMTTSSHTKKTTPNMRQVKPEKKEEADDDIIKVEPVDNGMDGGGKLNKRTCDFCGQVLEDIYILKSHLRMHVGNDNKCAICGKMFTDILQLADHTKSHNPFLSSTSPPDKGSSLSPTSKKTGLAMSNKQKVKKQLMQTDRLGSPVPCVTCGLKFPNQDLLNQHSMVHLQKLPENLYECEFCNKAFYKPLYLNRHKLICTQRLGDQNSIPSKEKEEVELPSYLLQPQIELKTERKVVVKKEEKSPAKVKEEVTSLETKEISPGKLDKEDHILLTGEPVSSQPSPPPTVPPEFSSNPFIVSEIETSRLIKGIKKGSSVTITEVPKKKKQHGCVICQKAFSSETELELHKTDCYLNSDTVTSSGAVQFPCAICGRGFSDRVKLFKHMQAEHLSSSPEATAPTPSLVTMVGSNSVVGNKTCEICGEAFEKVKALKEHYLHIHNLKRKEEGFVQADREFECDICNRDFADAYKLKRHRAIHTGEYNFECHLCDRKFFAKDQLERHISLHNAKKEENAAIEANGMRPVGPSRYPFNNGRFKCDICGRGLSDEWKLKRHRARHTGDLPHGCDVCGKRFFDNYSRTKHMTTVHPQFEQGGGAQTSPTSGSPSKRGGRVTNFRCDVCNQYFADAYKLRRHHATHTGDLPYHCTFCPRRFFANYQLSKHIEKFHEDQQDMGHHGGGGRLVGNQMDDDDISSYISTEVMDDGDIIIKEEVVEVD